MLYTGRSLLALLFFSLTGHCALVAAKITKDEQKAFDRLVKAVIKEGGYVHPSIGILSPAPSGAPRGIGMVENVKPKIESGKDMLMKVPYSYQMTRDLAMSTLMDVIPPMVLVDAPLLELDDSALLVLLLAHEYGLGKNSKFHAYTEFLPSWQDEGGGCGYENVQDFRQLPAGIEPEEIEMALQYATHVSLGMYGDYGEYLANDAWPREWKDEPALALRWAMCVVSSRATAANRRAGDNNSGTGVRLIPLVDLANHRKASSGFVELSGSERIVYDDFMDATSDDTGSFVVRSAWKCGTTRVDLEKGDEITVNYNLPAYQAVDWFLSLGFLPAELSSNTMKTNDEL
ncbi:unnamed protein product [Cylindrotheca closterium]|uniref:SET domain-containing protein n=1 Tax=Cylindrotheca closterium TaxID=2856 RepID=A0AAD2G0H7_9STRA|nr:unnamed protein product [Cylindrotheca closterium]